jgi:hypothetical protein
MNLTEFRTKYPQYEKTPDEVLIPALHRKYYADKLSIEEFAEKIGYQPKVEEPVAQEEEKPELSLGRIGGALKAGAQDVARSTLQALSGIAKEGVPESVRAGAEAVFPLAKGLRLIPEATKERAATALKTGAEAPEFQTAKEFQGKSSGWIEDFARATPQMGGQILATLMGGPALGGSLMGLQIAGQTYEDAVKKGNDPGKALSWGIANAIVQAPMEQLGVSKISKLLKPQQAIIARLKEIGEAMGTEWLTEFLQSVPDSITNIFAQNPDKTTLENLTQIVNQLPETLKQGAYEGTLTAPWALLGAAGKRRQKPTEAHPLIQKFQEDLASGKLTVDQLKDLRQDPRLSGLSDQIDKLIVDAQAAKPLVPPAQAETDLRGALDEAIATPPGEERGRIIQEKVVPAMTAMDRLKEQVTGKPGRWVDERGGLIEETGPTRGEPKVEPSLEVEPTETPQMGVKKKTAQVDTIAGQMDLDEFESKGYAPEQVTKADWIALQRANRRKLGQKEGGDNPNAPWSEYEEYHKQAVKEALAKGEEVDPEVLKDYPDLKPREAAGPAPSPVVTPIKPETTQVVERPQPQPTKEPWEMTRKEYDQWRLEELQRRNPQLKAKLEKGGEGTDQRPLAGGQRGRTAFSRKGAEPGTFTHELRHMIDMLSNFLTREIPKADMGGFKAKFREYLKGKKRDVSEYGSDYSDAEVAGELINEYFKDKERLKSVFPDVVEFLDATGIEKYRDLNVSHKAQIKQALSEGKPVPASVLADYPDLQKQAPIPKAEEKVEPGPVGEAEKGKTGNLLLRMKDGTIHESTRDEAPVHGIMVANLGLNTEDVAATGLRDKTGKAVWSKPKEVKAFTVEQARAAVQQRKTETQAKIRKMASEAPTIRRWIESIGGMNPDDPTLKGELRDIMWTVNSKGRKIRAKGYGPKFLNKNARSSDDITLQAVEWGWLPEGSDENDLMEAIRRNISVTEKWTNAGNDIDDFVRKEYEKVYQEDLGENWQDEVFRRTREEDNRGVKARLQGAPTQEVAREEGVESEEWKSLLETAEEAADEIIELLPSFQQSLFGPKGKPAFELTPTEPTPEEKIAIARQKGEVAQKGEGKRAVIPAEKIKAATTGKQVSLLPPKKGETEELFPQAEPTKSVKIDLASLSEKNLSLMDRTLKGMGYDSRGPQDVKEMLESGRVVKDGFLWHPDWITAYQNAVQGKALTAEVTERGKKWASKLKKEYGITFNLKEAGYILQDGSLIDLSGKRQGGPSNTRALDHREVGQVMDEEDFGSESDYMHQFMLESGAIRLSFFGDDVMLDVTQAPTDRQLRIIGRALRQGNGTAVIDVTNVRGSVLASTEIERATPAKIRAFIEKAYKGEPTEVLPQVERKAFPSTSRPLTRALDLQTLSTHVDRIVRRWKNAPLVNPIDTYESLPDQVKEVLAERYSKADIQGLKGLFVGYRDHKPTVFLIADKIPSTLEAERTVLHEVIGHYGVRQALGKNDRIDRFLKGVYFAKSKQIKEMVEKFPAYKYDPKKGTGYNLETPEGRMKAADEWFAREVAEKGIEQDPWLKRQWDRLVQILNDALRAMGFRVILSDAEIRQALRASVRAVEKGPAKGIQVSSVAAEIKAFHGSPTRGIKKFEDRFIGTGEGAQSFGYGHYFSSLEEIAGTYDIPERRISKALDPIPIGVRDIARIESQRLNKGSIDMSEAVRMLKNASRSLREKPDSEVAEMINTVAEAYKPNIYSVTLHKGKQPGEYDYLRWDEEPTKEQWFKIKTQLSKEPNATSPEGFEAIFKRMYEDYNGQELYDHLKDEFGSPKKASLFLLRAGIDGIEYPVGTLSGTSYRVEQSSDRKHWLVYKGNDLVRQENTQQEANNWARQNQPKNYVVFDENAITIDREGGSDIAASIEPADVNTSEFKKWFGKSKVVDENGKPLVVYHGTPAKFNAFKKTAIRDAGFYARGFYLTKDPIYAKLYTVSQKSKNLTKSSNVMQLYASIQDPFDFDNPTEKDFERIWKVIDERRKEKGLDPNTAERKASYKADFLNAKGSFTTSAAYERASLGLTSREILERAGYDGAFANNKQEIVAFSPTQIKSIYNRGTWNPEIADISASIEKPLDPNLQTYLDNALKEVKAGTFTKEYESRKVEKDVTDQKAIDAAYKRSIGNMMKGYLKGDKYDAKKFYEDTGINIEGGDAKDLNRWFRRLQTKQDQARNYPQMRRLLEAEQTYAGNSNAMSIEDRKVTEPYYGLKKKAKDKVDAALFHGDKIRRNVSNKTLMERFKLDENERKGFWALRKFYDNKRDIMAEFWLEHMLTPKEAQEILKNAQKTEIKEVLQDAVKAINTRNTGMIRNKDKEATQDRFRKDLARLGFGIGHIDQIASEGGLADHILRLRGYVPHQWDSEWRVYAEDKEGTKYLFDLPDFKIKRHLTAAARERIAKDYAAQVLQKELGKNVGRVWVGQYKNLPVDLFQDVGFAKMNGIVNSAVENISGKIKQEMGTDVSQDAINEITNRIQANINEMWLAKGAGRHLIGRQDVLGYRQKDLSSITAEYAVGVNAWYNKAIKAKQFAEVMKDINPKRTPEMWKDATEYISDMLGETSEAGWFKRLAGIYYLAGDISAAALNMTQNWTHAVALLRKIQPKTGKITAEREIATAMRDVMREYLSKIRKGEMFVGESQFIEPKAREAMKEAFARGILDPQYFGETTAFHANKVYQSYTRNLMSVPFKMFTGTEGWNRMSTFLAAFRRAVNAEEKDPVKVAGDTVNGAHFIYGRGNRPEIIRKLGALGNVMYTYMTYPVNNLVFIKHRVEDLMQAATPQERKVALKVIGSNLAYIFAFGGLNALPFAFLAKLAQKLFDDPEDDWEKWLYEQTAKPEMLPESMKKAMARGLTKGLPSILGNDLSWRVEGTDILGAPIGLQTARQIFYYKPRTALKQLQRGEGWHTLFFMLPDMLANPYKAFFVEGGTGIEGHPPIEYTTPEKVIRGMGFSPTREGEVRKAQEISKRKHELRLNKLEHFAERLIQAQKKPDRRDLVDLLHDVKEYNKQESAKKREGLPIPWNDIVKSAKQRKKGREKAFNQRLPKYMRPFQKEVGESFGINR